MPDFLLDLYFLQRELSIQRLLRASEANSNEEVEKCNARWKAQLDHKVYERCGEIERVASKQDAEI